MLISTLNSNYEMIEKLCLKSITIIYQSLIILYFFHPAAVVLAFSSVASCNNYITKKLNQQLISHLCSLSMSSSLTSSLRTSGMRNSSVQIWSGRCFNTSNVSYMLGHFLRTFLGRAAFISTKATRNKTLTPSHRNISQILKTDGHGRVLEKIQRNHSVM